MKIKNKKTGIAIMMAAMTMMAAGCSATGSQKRQLSFRQYD